MNTTEILLCIFIIICMVAGTLLAVAGYGQKKATKFFNEFDNQKDSMPTYPENKAYLQGIIDESNSQIANSTIKAEKRSHKSRRALFSLEQALKDGMAILVDGKSHVYVGIRPARIRRVGSNAELNYYFVRGISNGQGYGRTHLDLKGKLEYGIHSEVRPNMYLINIRK